jgi:hypothetical protein
VNDVKAFFRMPIAPVVRALSAAALSTLALGALTASPSAATTMPCVATVLHLPHTYSVVTIRVSTKPGAQVAATESAGGRSWAMTPGASANAAGRANLNQKVAAVAKFEVVRVSVRVTWNGLTAHCATQYTPPSLVARN